MKYIGAIVREQKGLSIQDVSKKTGIKVETLEKLERDEKVDVTVAMLKKIALVLNVETFNELFF